MHEQTYSIGNSLFRLVSDEEQPTSRLLSLWQLLFNLIQINKPVRMADMELHFSHTSACLPAPSGAKPILNARNLAMWQTKRGFYLEGKFASLDIDLTRHQGIGVLAEEFWQIPMAEQREFLIMGMLQLFSQHNFYGLHANGIVKHGKGTLILANPGSGKTTLALTLVRAGWQYVADDAVLIHQTHDRVDALAMRRGFSVSPSNVTAVS